LNSEQIKAFSWDFFKPGNEVELHAAFPLPLQTDSILG